MQRTQLHKNLNANDKHEVLPRDEDPCNFMNRKQDIWCNNNSVSAIPYRKLLYKFAILMMLETVRH